MSEKGIEIYDRAAPNKGFKEKLMNTRFFPSYVNINYDIILDSPYETEEDFVTTLRGLSKLPRPYYLNLYHLTYYEGTDIREKAIEDGIITSDDMSHIDTKYGGIDDTYINSIYRMIDATAGYVPGFIVYVMTSEAVRKTPVLCAIFKQINEMIVSVLRMLKFKRLVRLFHVLTSGSYGWQKVKTKFGFSKPAKIVKSISSSV